MTKQTVADVDVQGKIVLMRTDFNVPLDGEKITDDRRITQAMPSIRSIVDRGGKLVLMSHLGRPKGKASDKFSLEPVAKHLKKLLQVCRADPIDGLGAKNDLGTPSVTTDAKVGFATDCIGPDVEEKVKNLNPGDVLLLQNVRFHPGEEQNDPKFAQAMVDATKPDVYVNDAFGTAHREHASTFGVPQLLEGKPRTIGFLIRKELEFLGGSLDAPKSPFVAILGGAKVSDKIKVIERLLDKADLLLIGGAMAYTFALAQGKDVGDSLVERDKVVLAKDLLARGGDKIKLPTDTVIAQDMSDTAETQVVQGTIPTGWEGFDIGPETREAYSGLVRTAGTVLWNGPMGVFEKTPFAAGTQVVAEACAAATKEHDAITIIGGGDSAAAVEKLGLSEQVSHVSTGGGASLEFLEKGHFATLDILD
jgi:phosphoglycerate kinase